MTLVELMVAMVLGLFLSAVILEVFIANKQTNRFVEAATRQQESIRFAVDTLTEQLRSAGFTGCNSDPKLRVYMLTTANAPKLAGVCAQNKCSTADMIDILTVASANGQRPYLYGNSTSHNMPVGSAAIGFYRSEASLCSATTSAELSASSSAINLNAACDFGADPYLMLASCSELSVVRVNGETDGDTSLALKNSSFAGLLANLPAQTEIYKLTGSLFYVGCQTSDDTDCGLYYDDDIDDGGNPQELVKGIADLRARYGVDTDTISDGSANRFVDDPSSLTIAGVDNPWHRVVSIRLAFLSVSGEDNLADTPASYTFPPWAASATTPTDQRIRRVYTTTVTLRNRVANLRNNI